MTLDATTGPVTEFVVAEPVLASVAASAARGTSGVVRLEPGLRGLLSAWSRAARQRWKGLTPAPAEGVRVEYGPDGVLLQVDLVTDGVDQAAAVGTAVQRAVSRAVLEETGETVAGVSVSIVDIEPVEPGPALLEPGRD